MEITDKRIKHSLAVARNMRAKALELKPNDTEYAEEMFTLGLLHDIGYEFSESLGHEQYGGLLLQRLGYKYWQEVYIHGTPFPCYKSDALALLMYADMTTGPNGENMTVDERLCDIADRHGKESPQYNNCTLIADTLTLLDMI